MISKKTISVAFLICIISINISYAQDFEWAKRTGGIYDDYSGGNAIDNNGNVYTIGSFKGTVDFDPGIGVFNLSSVGMDDAFIQKLDANGNFIWAKRVGGNHYDYMISIALDDKGDIYLNGMFMDTVDFNPNNGDYFLSAVKYADVFVLKLDSSGNFIWAKSMGGEYAEFVSSINIDELGNVYTTGSFMDTVDFDPGDGVYNLESQYFSDVFVQKLDSDGNFIWAKSIEGNSEDVAGASVIDSLGNIYTTGYFSDTADFDPGNGVYVLTPEGENDLFIQKLDSNGNFVWAKRVGGASYTRGISIAIDNYGSIYTTGIFSGTVDFNPGAGINNLTSTNAKREIFILKLDNSGNYTWAKRIGDSGDDNASSIYVDDRGDVYTVGTFTGTVDFDPSNGVYNLTMAGSGESNYDIFIQKLNSDGNFIWAKRIGGTSIEYSTSIITDNNNNIYLTGAFRITVDFNPGIDTNNLISEGWLDIFTLKLSQNTVGINEQNNDRTDNLTMSLYPNPNKGKFVLKVNTSSIKAQTFQLEVYTSMGKLIYNDRIIVKTNLQKQIDIEGISRGMYFLRLTNNNQTIVGKLLVE